VFSKPEGANISFDGKDTGKKTPATLEGVATGEYQLILKKDSYYPKEVTISVLKGKAIREDLLLEGGNLVEYQGEWLEPDEKDRLMLNAINEAERIANENKRKADEALAAKHLADKNKIISDSKKEKVSMVLYGTDINLDKKIEKKLTWDLAYELDNKGFVLSDTHARINDAYQAKYGSTNLSTLNFMNMSNDRAMFDIIKKYPSIGAFTPFNMLSFKLKNEKTTWLGHVSPELMSDVAGMKDPSIRAKFIRHFEPMDAKISEVMESTKQRKITYAGLPSSPMMKFSFDIPQDADIQEWMDMFQEKYESAFENKGYLIAGYKDMKKAWMKMELGEPFEQYFVYSLINFGMSYEIFDNVPEAGGFGPGSMYFYVNKGERKLHAGMPKVAVWAAATGIEGEKKQLCLKTDKEIMSIMNNL